MDDYVLFERNLLALSRSDAELCARLSAARTTRGRYRFLSSRSGDVIPALVNRSGAAHPLHSLMDPRREAARLVATVQDGGMLVILGLGGGYGAEAALARRDVNSVLVIESDIDGMAELLAAKDYVGVLSDERVRLLVDASPGQVRSYLLSTYRPALFGGISVLPLRPRVDADPTLFDTMSSTIRSAIAEVSNDYSVQAYFGKRWFANAIRNLAAASFTPGPVPPAKRVAITAAGPSLETCLDSLRRDRASRFILATDTSLPALLSADIRPDAVVSIDCQHISYYHFMDGLPEDVSLFLDLASPPVVASRSAKPRFFSGGHPLTVYVSRNWRPIPYVDTSGGNVTYAAVALADALGAERIELYGADFSYPRGGAYARGTYIHPYFQRAQNRLAPLESLFAAFLYRNETLERHEHNGVWRYETKSLADYRERLEALAPTLSAELVPTPGPGAPITVRAALRRPARSALPLFASGRASMGPHEFLSLYRDRILQIPSMTSSASSFLSALSVESRDVLTTLLPTAAAIRRRYPALNAGETLDAVREYCLEEIGRVLRQDVSSSGEPNY